MTADDLLLSVFMDRVQTFAGVIDAAESLDLPAITNQWVLSIPEPVDVVHRLLLGGLLANIAMRIVERMHTPRTDGTCLCYSSMTRLLRDGLSPGCQNTRTTFVDWLALFTYTYEQAHPLPYVAVFIEARR